MDTATFAKNINAYLCIAFNSCVPKSVKRSFITAEIQRHLRRCSAAEDYYNELCKFYNRLRARGYPQQFLQPLFEHAPQHSRRSSFLFKTTGNNKAASPCHGAKDCCVVQSTEINDLYPVLGKNHLDGSQPANVLNAAAINVSGHARPQLRSST